MEAHFACSWGPDAVITMEEIGIKQYLIDIARTSVAAKLGRKNLELAWRGHINEKSFNKGLQDYDNYRKS
jgi:hypothetical protein